MSQPDALTATPLLAYRWVDTDRALAEQLALEAEGHAATLSPGHAAVRFTNPTTGRDVLPTIRTEMHRVRAGAQTHVRREVGSSVYQVFDGTGSVTRRRPHLDRCAAATCSSCRRGCRSRRRRATAANLDLFRFSDAPIFEALHAHRAHVGD